MMSPFRTRLRELHVRYVDRFPALHQWIAMLLKHRLRNIRPHVASLTAQTLPGVVFVVCVAAKSAPIYRPRRPRQSALFRTIERYLPEFERTYDRSDAKQYGPWRRIICAPVPHRQLVFTIPKSKLKEFQGAIPASLSSSIAPPSSTPFWPTP